MHRDIKPDSILVDDECNVFPSDFGASPVCTDKLVSGVEGSRAFMASEVCRGGAKFTGHLVYVWALGVSLSQLTYGVRPLIASNTMDLSRWIIGEPLVLPDEDPSGWLAFANEFGLPDVQASSHFKELMQGMLQKKKLAEQWSVRRIQSCNWLADLEKYSLSGSFPQHSDETSVQLELSLEDIADTIVSAGIMYI